MLTDDGRMPDAGDYHPISSPGAFGSGELKTLVNPAVNEYLTRIRDENDRKKEKDGLRL